MIKKQQVASDKPRRGRGRPTLGDGEALRQTAFRFTQAQLDWLDAQSEMQGRVGRNVILRRLVDGAMQQRRRSSAFENIIEDE